jgi:hypothetical protein
MRFIAVIGLAVLAAGCAPKLEFVDGNAGVRQTAPPLAQADESEAAGAAQMAKPAIRNARPSSFRAQTVAAHDQRSADAQNSLTVSAARTQPNIVTPAVTVAPSGTTQRDGEVTPQAARVDAAERAPGQAPDPAQEIAVSPVRERALSPVRETSLSPARETALSPARDAALNDGFVQASACIRNNMKAAYRSSDTVDQATSFLMKICFAPFSSAIASDEASAKSLFRGLVFQEISPVEWLEALREGASQSR